MAKKIRVFERRTNWRRWFRLPRAAFEETIQGVPASPWAGSMIDLDMGKLILPALLALLVRGPEKLPVSAATISCVRRNRPC
jgi:hypothetical protein